MTISLSLCAVCVQTAVDRTSHLIAEYEVTNSCNDYNNLAQVAKAAKETLDVETIHAGADKGYEDQGEIEQCIYNGIIPHVGFKNDKIERLLVIEYEEAAITEEDRASAKPQDINVVLKPGSCPHAASIQSWTSRCRSRIRTVALSAIRMTRLPVRWDIF